VRDLGKKERRNEDYNDREKKNNFAKTELKNKNKKQTYFAPASP
jgi:hypothetical protein